MLEHGHRPEFVKQTPPAYQELAERCWQLDWTKRPSCQEIRGILKDIVLSMLESLSDANASGKPPRKPAAA